MKVTDPVGPKKTAYFAFASNTEAERNEDMERAPDTAYGEMYRLAGTHSDLPDPGRKLRIFAGRNSRERR